MLIIACFFFSSGYSQGGLNSLVKYEAKDSIVANIPKQTVKLYGEAIVEFEDILVTADIIEINLTTNEVIATFSLDSLGNPVGKPVFTSAGEESKCDYIKYNFNTKKGYIKEVRSQQGGGYIHMAESKIHPNEEIHLRDGKFTTCDADTPHYHFKLTKAIIVPEKRIVTGPVYMKLFKIPLPLAAPFAFLPNSDSRKHGIIIPSLGNAGKYGFGIQNLG
ncbi:MAG: LPS-assembly protein LptD, partial [Lentisphaeria bacterium]|nr:LPS-assembly protein LptD [Lentisphaeria bacterium]